MGNIAFSERFGSAYPAVLQAVAAVNDAQFAAASAMDAQDTAAYATDPIAAVEAMTAFQVSNGQKVFSQVCRE